jgi:anti-anti-sigma factor
MQDLPPHAQVSSVIAREADGGARLLLRGELDMNGVIETERAVRDAAALSETRLTIDLSDLTFMDLFGARTLLRVADEVHSGGRQVVIANPRPHVRRLFEMITDLAPGRSLVAELVQDS